jgi:hypothetical protein
MIDWRWQSNGGILLDGTGDIALTSGDGVESLYDMVRTRLKAALSGWKLYPIGAGLQDFIGQGMDANMELELDIKRQVSRSLMFEFLPKGSFQLETLSMPGQINLYVYLSGELLAMATITSAGEIHVE